MQVTQLTSNFAVDGFVGYDPSDDSISVVIKGSNSSDFRNWCVIPLSGQLFTHVATIPNGATSEWTQVSSLIA
jgi:hypothetical protein